ncbi:MAG: hypothetical protein ABI461_04565 [Polyangiaceae bacterium]
MAELRAAAEVILRSMGRRTLVVSFPLVNVFLSKKRFFLWSSLPSELRAVFPAWLRTF